MKSIALLPTATPPKNPHNLHLVQTAIYNILFCIYSLSILFFLFITKGLKTAAPEYGVPVKSEQTMTRRTDHTGSAALLLAALLTSSAAFANGYSPAQKVPEITTVKNFKLTDEFLHKWKAYHDEVAMKPCELSPVIVFSKPENESLTLGQSIAVFDAEPAVHAALTKVGLNAREAVLGMILMISASAEESGLDRSTGIVSPENLAFYRRHKDEWQQHQKRVEQEMMRQNGGRLPECMYGTDTSDVEDEK